VVVGVLVLAGCAAADRDVASARDVASSSSSVSVAAVLPPQRERAEAMAACLADVSIAATLNDQEDGQTQLDIDIPSGDDTFVWVQADGQSSQARDIDESTAMVEAAWAEDRSLLWLRGVDRTAEYDACVEETEFTQPGLFADSATEQRLKQLRVDLNNDFAACARANGFPEIKDQPPPVIDGGATQGPGQILLPWRVTEDGLRDLLAECPVFDEGRLRELAGGQNRDKWFEETIVGPNLFLDIPNMNTTGISDEDLPRAKSLWEVVADAAGRQLEEVIEKLAGEGITYDGPRPNLTMHWGD
jgi:hypothetical protein